MTRFRVDGPTCFRLADYKPRETLGFDKDAAEKLMAAQAERLADLQERLYAEHSWALLIILQGVDASGKDSTIKKLMAGLNPQGCVVHPFKVPAGEDLAHDFLWRAIKLLPARGCIGIFNRSYYEDVLVVRVHKELLRQQQLPRKLITPSIWQDRFEAINALERHLIRNGTLVVKFHLRISKTEQKHRLLRRLVDPTKRWKFSISDLAERKLWKQHMAAYQDMIRHTSTPEAPWYVVPADHKWFARLVVATAIVDLLDRLELKFPSADLPRLRQIRKSLEAE